MQIIVSSCLTLRGFELEARSLRERWRVPNPAYIAAERMGRYCGHLDRYITAADGHDVALTLPRGLLGEVERLYPSAEMLDETRGVASYGMPAAVVTLRPYQAEAVEAACSTNQGYVVAPCGAGKTTIGIEIIRRTGQRALVLVHTRDLLTQWQSEIKRQLGEWGEGWVTVATVQSLWGTAAREAKPLPPHGLLMMDELHHVAARCFSEVVGRSKARYRYGLTATPDREDGLGALIGWTFGDELYRVAREGLIDEGHLVTPRLEMVRTGFEPETVFQRSGELDWAGIVTQLAEDPGRLRLVADLAVGEARAGHVVLVLTTRVEHASALDSEIGAKGVLSAVVTGDLSAKVRAARLASVRSGEVPVLIATQLADEGLDLPILDRLILALPSRAHGRTIQRVGRIMRPAPGKGQPVVFDLVDEHAACWGQWHKRRKAFAEACGAQP